MAAGAPESAGGELSDPSPWSGSPDLSLPVLPHAVNARQVARIENRRHGLESFIAEIAP